MPRTFFASRHDRSGDVDVTLPSGESLRRSGGTWLRFGDGWVPPSADELKDDWTPVLGAEGEALIAEAEAALPPLDNRRISASVSPQSVEKVDVGRFGRMWLMNLRESKPDLYAQLEQEGKLVAEANKIDDRAEEVFDTTLSELEKQHPQPDGSIEKIQHMTALMGMAREIACEASGVQVFDDEIERMPDGSYR